MKYTFVLDENVLISASTGKNARNQKDYSSCNLLLQILRNCHKIAWNNELKKKYSEKTGNLLRCGRKYELIFMQASKIFFHLMATKDKNLQNENYLTLEPDLDDDKHVISLAVFTRAILVTEDCKLKEKLQEKALITKHNLITVEPKEALSFADET